MVLLRERRRTRPGFVEPCLPTLAKKPPNGSDWIHEIKHDGFRIMGRRDAGGPRLISRNGHDFSERFPFINFAIGALPREVVSDRRRSDRDQRSRACRFRDYATTPRQCRGRPGRVRPA